MQPISPELSECFGKTYIECINPTWTKTPVETQVCVVFAVDFDTDPHRHRITTNH